MTKVILTKYYFGILHLPLIAIYILNLPQIAVFQVSPLSQISSLKRRQRIPPSPRKPSNNIRTPTVTVSTTYLEFLIIN